MTRKKREETNYWYQDWEVKSLEFYGYWEERDYYANEFDNLDKIDKCHVKQKLAKFIQEEVDNLNSPMSVKQTEFAIKDPFTQKLKR